MMIPVIVLLVALSYVANTTFALMVYDVYEEELFRSTLLRVLLIIAWAIPGFITVVCLAIAFVAFLTIMPIRLAKVIYKFLITGKLDTQ